MVRDHEAVNRQAVALVTRLHVTRRRQSGQRRSEQAPPTATLHRLGAAAARPFDRAYVDNEVAYHRTVNGAMRDTLIPSAQNARAEDRLLQSSASLCSPSIRPHRRACRRASSLRRARSLWRRWRWRALCPPPPRRRRAAMSDRDRLHDFGPAPAGLKTGDTIVWVNRDIVAHSWKSAASTTVSTSPSSRGRACA